MKEFWDERYSAAEYVYGKEPNLFFREELDKLSVGRLLLPGEGEGRNAVYAARSGWEVDAFDVSREGKSKCLRLANEYGVTINYSLAGYTDFDSQKKYNAVGLFFTHQPSHLARSFHKRVQQFLLPGGTVILEGFHKDQLAFATGGPSNPDFLYSVETLEEDFSSLDIKILRYVKRELREGLFHRGEAAVVQLLAVKK